jgi:putative transposase
MAAIDEIHTELPFYGIRRIRGELFTRGLTVGRTHLATLMRTMGITAISPKRRTSKPAPGHKIYPYLLRGLEICEAGKVWCADVTYLPMARGFCYLTAVMELGLPTRALLAALEHARCRLLRRGARMALERYAPPEIFNTDQGSQFTCEGFTGLLAFRGVAISMDGRGRWLDNIFIERLWRSVKHEEVYLKAYDDLRQARRELGAYFDFYNCRRRHQGLADRTPDEVYWSTLRTQAAA